MLLFVKYIQLSFDLWICEQERTGEEDAVVISPEELIKHPLQNTWALWYFKNDKSRDWCDNLRRVITFSTVEDFWS